jgi:hypothetical protein
VNPPVKPPVCLVCGAVLGKDPRVSVPFHTALGEVDFHIPCYNRANLAGGAVKKGEPPPVPISMIELTTEYCGKAGRKIQVWIKTETDRRLVIEHVVGELLEHHPIEHAAWALRMHRPIMRTTFDGNVIEDDGTKRCPCGHVAYDHADGKCLHDCHPSACKQKDPEDDTESPLAAMVAPVGQRACHRRPNERCGFYFSTCAKHPDRPPLPPAPPRCDCQGAPHDPDCPVQRARDEKHKVTVPAKDQLGPFCEDCGKTTNSSVGGSWLCYSCETARRARDHRPEDRHRFLPWGEDQVSRCTACGLVKRDGQPVPEKCVVPF